MTSNDTAADYAYWISPDQTLTVNYSLEQFQEIDFQVNEGFRRIPHGGIEIGGLLFGRSEASSIRIQAFRLIECEHATGPSFHLSERDLELLEKQIAASRSDPELAGLEILGWFIAHTRTGLRLNDREQILFDRFFPKPNQIAVLVKPERFQPTKFGFLVRRPDGSLERDAANTAIILPLSGKSGRSTEGPIASMPAPAARPAVASEGNRPLRNPPPSEETTQPQPELSKLRKRNLLLSSLAEPTPSEPTSAEAPIPNSATQTPPPAVTETPVASAPESVTSLTTIPKESRHAATADVRRRRPDRDRAVATSDDEGKTYTLRLAIILFVAAALGCGVGYWGYRQLPSSVVPLRIQPEASGLVVHWPVDQTYEAGYAAIRVNDGAQQPLSAEEKRSGAARIAPASDSNIKVELIVQHWMRDSRGIVRYIRLVPGSTAPATSQQLLGR
jgi:hypothetical protein